MPTINSSAVSALINPDLILLNSEPPYGGPLARDTTKPFLLYQCLLVWVDHLTALVLRRINYHLGRQIAEVINFVAFDILKLSGHHAFHGPLAVLTKSDVAYYRLECRFSDVLGKLAVVERFCLGDSLSENL